nr:PREDICTED: leucine-rich repeat-containing protein 52-like [Latimeria chalumnae]|eukprot:XP_014343141.1 PREDICTED: leucine-rich repeat-containing protein 52-like [Latimeria chalumnae]
MPATFALLGIWYFIFTLLMPFVIGCPAMCTCNYLTVNCQGRQLKSFPSDIPLSTKRLILADNDIKELPSVFLNLLSELVHLDCRNNSLMEVHREMFLNLQKLVYLDLSHNSLSKIEPKAFESLTALLVLKMGNNQQLTEVDKTAFSSNVKLIELDLSGGSLSLLNVSVLNALTSLKSVRLAGNLWRCNCRLQKLSEKMRANIEVFSGKFGVPKQRRGYCVFIINYVRMQYHPFAVNLATLGYQQD